MRVRDFFTALCKNFSGHCFRSNWSRCNYRVRQKVEFLITQYRRILLLKKYHGCKEKGKEGNKESCKEKGKEAQIVELSHVVQDPVLWRDFVF